MSKMHLADSRNLAVIIIIITIMNANMSYRERDYGHSFFCVQSNVESGNLCSWNASVQAELRSATSDDVSVTLWSTLSEIIVDTSSVLIESTQCCSDDIVNTLLSTRRFFTNVITERKITNLKQNKSNIQRMFFCLVA